MFISRLRCWPVFVAGLLLPLSFAPLEWGPLAVPLLAFLFYKWQGATSGEAWWTGWLFGTGMFLGGTYWVYISMHDYGGIPVVVAALLTFLFALFLGLFPAMAGWLSRRYLHIGNTLDLWLVFPAVWVLMEWTRSWFLTGFPWLNLGASQVGWPLQGYAPLTGEYGMSWLLALTAAGLVALLKAGLRKRIVICVALALVWVAGVSLDQVEWTQKIGKPFKVALVQANVSQEKKWDPDFRQEIISDYRELTRPHWNVDVVIWPETAISAFYHYVPESIDDLEKVAIDKGFDMLVGIPYLDPADKSYYNSVLSLGTERAFYHKRHLVPFGEFIPFQKYISDVLDFMGLPMSGFSRGEARQPPLKAGGYLAGLTICYEIIFNSEVIQSLPAAQYLVNISNNTWFGDSSMPYQQLQMSRLRARETERYVLSATNDGVSAVIDSAGAITARSPRFRQAVLTATVQARAGATPFVRWGNYPVLFALGCIFIAVRLYRRKLFLAEYSQ